MYYRVAIRVDGAPTWQWKSTVLSELSTLFHFLRLFRALPEDRLRVFSSSSRVGLVEQLEQENSGGGSASVTAARFLQQHLLHSNGGTSAEGARGYETTASIAVSTTTRLNESGGTAHVLGERSMDSLERKRFEYERGAGGDHDLPYHFALPLFLPQVLAWMTLLGRVQCGEVEP